MAGDWRDIVTRGQPFRPTAAKENDTTRVIQEITRNRQRSDTRNKTELPEGVVYVRNSSDDLVERFGVMSITGVVIDYDTGKTSFLNNFILDCDKPTIQFPGQFVIAFAPIPKNKIGPAWAFGVCPTQINMQSADDLYADILDGDSTQLNSGSSGAAQILYNQPGTGTKWALVRFPAGSQSKLEAVDVSSTGGGTAGDATTKCSFIYNWTDPDGTDHYAESPTMDRRLTVGAMREGTHGIARRKDDGTWDLYDVDEAPDAEACSDDSGDDTGS